MIILKWINKQFEWAKSALSEPTGKASSKRIFTLVIIIVFIKSYSTVSVANQHLEDIPTNWALFLLALIIGKQALDLWKERKG